MRILAKYINSNSLVINYLNWNLSSARLIKYPLVFCCCLVSVSLIHTFQYYVMAMEQWNYSSITSQGILKNAGKIVHYNDVIMGLMASQITSLTIVYSTIYSAADQRKHQSSTSLAFVRNSPHKWPVTRKCFHLMTSSCSSIVNRLYNHNGAKAATQSAYLMAYTVKCFLVIQTINYVLLVIDSGGMGRWKRCLYLVGKN